MEKQYPAIEIRELEVKFGGFKALSDVSLSIANGEVVGLLGENGAGKSTLIKVLAGVNTPSKGLVLLHGKQVDFQSPRHAIENGISTVHQHSMLVSTLTVAENLVLGMEPSARMPGYLNGKLIVEEAQRVADRFGFALPLTARVENLSLPERQIVEIVRAASRATSLLILDEPTASLEPRDVDRLFSVIRKIKGLNIPVLYISHRLDEIPQICDRAVILRDGKRVGELPGQECTQSKLVPIIAGRPIGELFPVMPEPEERILLSLRGFRPNIPGFEPVDIDLRSGDVLGLTGGTGAGQREFARAVAGILPSEGSISLAGQQIPNGSVPAATRRGIVYVSGDRAEGVFPIEPVWRNAAVGSWSELTKFAGFISFKAERLLGLRVSKEYGVRASSLDAPISELSGGNQQKALIARWAAVNPKVMILDEPTLGVDVGSRREIYDLLRDLVDKGMAIILVSADFAELRGISRNVKVFSRNQITKTLVANEATDHAIMAAREII